VYVLLSKDSLYPPVIEKTEAMGVPVPTTDMGFLDVSSIQEKVPRLGYRWNAIGQHLLQPDRTNYKFMFGSVMGF